MIIEDKEDNKPMGLILPLVYLSGLLTILAPCIWPILPLIFTESVLLGKKSKVNLFILGIIATFTTIILFSAILERYLLVDMGLIRISATIILVFTGITQISERAEVLYLKAFYFLVEKIKKLIMVDASKVSKKKNYSSLITGLGVGVLWTPCAGPILASIASLSATQNYSKDLYLISIFYLLGVFTSLKTFTILTQKSSKKFIKDRVGFKKIKLISGLLMIVFALSTLSNFDKIYSAKLLDKLPSVKNILTGFENSKLISEKLDSINAIYERKPIVNDLYNIKEPYPVPEFPLNLPLINADELKIEKGKVYLLDFWTYSCIDCIRSLGYIENWDKKYRKNGLNIIGIHTPEFGFEKEYSNVSKASKDLGVKYPVVLDNDYKVWDSFHNRYWPSRFLINNEGLIVRYDFGEGNYDEMEKAIQRALNENGRKGVEEEVSNPLNFDPYSDISRETYLGYRRFSIEQNPVQNYGLIKFDSGKSDNFSKKLYFKAEKKDISANTFQLDGEWRVFSDHIESEKNSSIIYNFTANNLYLVIKDNKPIGGLEKNTAKILLDGKPIAAKYSGGDVKNGILEIDTPRLYSIYNGLNEKNHGIIEIKFNNSNIEVYTFTFG